MFCVVVETYKKLMFMSWLVFYIDGNYSSPTEIREKNQSTRHSMHVFASALVARASCKQSVDFVFVLYSIKHFDYIAPR